VFCCSETYLPGSQSICRATCLGVFLSLIKWLGFPFDRLRQVASVWWLVCYLLFIYAVSTAEVVLSKDFRT
jgi:hypothetical protein